VLADEAGMTIIQMAIIQMAIVFVTRDRSFYRRHAARATAGMPPCVAKRRPDRSGIEKRRSPSRS
jgi:hypothetical protein